MKGIHCRALLDRVMSPEQAAELIGPGMTVGFSGFTRAGYPKAVPQAIAALGRAKGLTVITGASTGPELDESLSKAGLVAKRIPFQTDSETRRRINDGEIQFVDTHLGQLPRQIRQGFFGRLDYAVVECSEILEDGGVVPTTSAGASDTMLEQAESVILEVNLHYQERLKGFHDILREEDVPFRRELPIYRPEDHPGLAAIPCRMEKIRAVVLTDQPDAPVRFSQADETSEKIAGHILRFLEEEQRTGRLPTPLPPLQSGVGSVANAVLSGLEHSDLQHLQMYTEVVQDTALRLIRMGKIDYASCTALSVSAEGQRAFMEDLDFYRRHLVIRPQNISNHPELIHRLGIIAMNTAVECDLYGNVNSTNVLGSRLINGVGGSGDFARNAGLTIFSTPSIAKDGKISAIVPMVSHVDHVEHDVHVIVTEQGLADLRGKSPAERAECVMENCCHPMYRSALRAWFEQAKLHSFGQNIPVDLEEAFSWHVR